MGERAFSIFDSGVLVLWRLAGVVCDVSYRRGIDPRAAGYRGSCSDHPLHARTKRGIVAFVGRMTTGQ